MTIADRIARQFVTMDASAWNQSDSRVEVFRDDQTLLLKRQDVTVPRLSRVFKIKPQTLYLEEDITMNAEFPEEGQFHLSTVVGGRYKVCGDAEEVQGGEDQTHPTSSSSSSGSAMVASQGWSIPRPWMSSGYRGRMPLSTSTKKSQPQSYEPSFKRSIPLVTLSLDHTGKNVAVESTDDNVYIKIPESSVSVPAILSEIGAKVSIQPDELVILDSKCIPVTDGKDLDYWKTPSRRFYVARRSEHDKLLKQKGKIRLSLNRKRKMAVDLTEEDADDEHRLSRLERSIETVKNALADLKDETVRHHDKIAKLLSQHESYTTLKIRQLQHFECKICKSLPTQPVATTCCNQILGCRRCYEQSTMQELICPLCRSNDVSVLTIKGLTDIYKDLEKFITVDSDSD